MDGNVVLRIAFHPNARLLLGGVQLKLHFLENGTLFKNYVPWNKILNPFKIMSWQCRKAVYNCKH